QNGADAAALAGAQELDGTAASAPLAIAKAQEWAVNNGVTLDGPPVVNGTYTQITATALGDAPLTFGFAGLGDSDVRADATAGIASQNLPGKGVVPIGIKMSEY